MYEKSVNWLSSNVTLKNTNFVVTGDNLQRDKFDITTTLDFQCGWNNAHEIPLQTCPDLLCGNIELKHDGITYVVNFDHGYLTHFPLCRIYASVNRVSISSDSGVSPIRRQAIISTNAGLLSNWPSGTNFSEILIKIHNFSPTKMHMKISSAKWRPFCSGGD